MWAMLGFLFAIAVLLANSVFWAWLGDRRGWKSSSSTLGAVLTIAAIVVFWITLLVIVSVQGT